jgi:hypothetical protein
MAVATREDYLPAADDLVRLVIVSDYSVTCYFVVPGL